MLNNSFNSLSVDETSAVSKSQRNRRKKKQNGASPVAPANVHQQTPKDASEDASSMANGDADHDNGYQAVGITYQ